MRKQEIIIFFGIFFLAFVSFINGTTGTRTKKGQDQQKRLSEERVFKFKQLDVTLDNFDAEGFILDIGGGGEGVIGQLKGQQVIAIDISKRELEEAPAGPLKIVMDARDLKFLDKSFKTVTVFFTFMYITGSDHKEVFQELFRVLVPDGRLLIWDVFFPKQVDPKKDIVVFPLEIKLPDKVIKTGYGARWPKTGQGLTHYIQLAKEVGFTVITHKEKDQWFYLELKKP